MNGTDTGATMLALPAMVARGEAQRWHEDALALFEASYAPSGTLREDLYVSARFFDPVAQGQRLRRELGTLTRRSQRSEWLPELWQFDAPNGLALLTPEGIAGMHALRVSLDRSDARVLATGTAAGEVIPTLLEQYRLWNQHRLRGVVGLLTGSDSPLQLPVIGTILTLLVNNNVGPERALVRADNQDIHRRRTVDDSFFAAADAFARTLAPTSGTKSGGGQLFGGWYLGEISRRLGNGIVLVQASGSEKSSVFIPTDRVQKALQLAARDLGRGNRKRPTVTEVSRAYDALVDAFLERRDALGRFGDLHESPTLTLRRKQELLSTYQSVVEDTDRR